MSGSLGDGSNDADAVAVAVGNAIEGGGGVAAAAVAASAKTSSKQPAKHLLLSPSVASASVNATAKSPSLASAAAVRSSSPGGGGGGGGQGQNNSSGSIGNANGNDKDTAGADGGARSSSPLLASGSSSGPAAGSQQSENDKVYWLIVELLNPSTREAALLELSKKREQWDDLALVLWHSFGTFYMYTVVTWTLDIADNRTSAGVMSALLQEIVSVYPLLAPASLTAGASNRVCNALALLQCVASHNDTRALFLQAHIPLFLYPFLNTTSKTRPFEYLRLTSLGVIGALVKQNDNSDVINFLLSTEIIPLCLRIMETGSELSKTVAIFIVQKILLDEMGLAYICQTYERFYAVGTVLSNMVTQLVKTQAVRLLKHVVRCYLRLSDNLRAREALRACLPEPLRVSTISHAAIGKAEAGLPTGRYFLPASQGGSRDETMLSQLAPRFER